ncbi:MAG TPA: cytochrome c oxidase assembly protein [Acidimicrobiales bacterium]|nr:cytochrome c oxidase assembly protein [Acidimicrobiales bacterium]
MTGLPFHWHAVEIAVIVALGAAHHVAVRDARLRRRLELALAILVVVVAWPVGDLAASVSLTVATLQRLVVMLVVAPLVLRATPTEVFDRLTRPAPIDRAARVLAHPGAALVVVTVVSTLTLIVPVVDWGARSSLGRGVIVAMTLAAGLLLWLPVIHVVPGTRVLSPIARAGYVFAASVVVTSLSIVWIFARHPLYPGLHGQRSLIHVSPLLDQQVAGFVAKLGAYGPMWAMAFLIFSRADRAPVPVEETPLYWADVQRALLRADRDRAREARRRRGAAQTPE